MFVRATVDTVIDGHSHVAARLDRHNCILVDPACIIPLEDMCGACTQYPCSEHPLESVFNPVTFKAPNGDTLSVVMRDGGFELKMNDRPMCITKVDNVSMTYPEGTIIFEKDSTGRITDEYSFIPIDPSMSSVKLAAFLKRAKRDAEQRQAAIKETVTNDSDERKILTLLMGPDGKIVESQLNDFVNAIMKDMHKNTKEGPLEATAREGWHIRKAQTVQAISDHLDRTTVSKDPAEDGWALIARHGNDKFYMKEGTDQQIKVGAPYEDMKDDPIRNRKAPEPGSVPHMLEQAERVAEQIKRAYGNSEVPGKDTLISKSELIKREMRLIDQVKQVITHARPEAVLQRIYDERVQEYRSIKRGKA